MAVVGLGNIGMKYDAHLAGDAVITTHCRAIVHDERLLLAAGVDSDIETRELFLQLYGVPGYESVGEMMAAARPNVVAISVPTSSHLNVVREVLSAGRPRLILIEKPVGISFAEAVEIVSLCESAGCGLLVNFPRRVADSFLRVKNLLLAGSTESRARGVCWYPAGFQNNASHFLDLLFGWFGPAVLDGEPKLLSAVGSDLMVDFTIVNESSRIDFLCLEEVFYSHASIEIFFSKGRIRYDFGGTVIVNNRVTRDSVYPAESILSTTTEFLDGNDARLMAGVYDDVVAWLSGEKVALPTGRDSLALLRLLDEISERALGTNDEQARCSRG